MFTVLLPVARLRGGVRGRSNDRGQGQASRRFNKFELFPEALDLMARALKAGHAFSTG